MSGKRIIHAPRGNERTLQRLAAGSSDADADEQPRPGGCRKSRSTGRLRRDWPRCEELGSFRCDSALVARTRKRRNASRAIRKAGRQIPHARRSAARPDRQFQSRRPMVELSEFNRLERLGLTMYGQMTAGSWIYIGSQGIVQGTFETFAAAGRKHFGGSLDGKFVVTGGLGGMGGAQPLAATMNGAVFLGIDVDPARIEKRLKSGYCDKIAWSLDEALKLIDQARKRSESDFSRSSRQLRRRAARDRQTRHRARCAHRSNQRARCVKWLRAERDVARRRARVARERSGRIHRALDASDGGARRSHARVAKERRDHFRLRQQHSSSGAKGRREKRVRYSRVRS